VHIPLWLPWAVFAALVLPPLLEYADNRARVSAGGEGRAATRAWSPAAVALVVAVLLTVGQLRVSDDELHDAADDVAAVLSGQIGSVDAEKLEVLIGDRLGHDVYVTGVENPDEDDHADYFEVSLKDPDDSDDSSSDSDDSDDSGSSDDGPPVVCVQVSPSSSDSDPITVFVNSYACDRG
jgi:hypothetical protein